MEAEFLNRLQASYFILKDVFRVTNVGLTLPSFRRWGVWPVAGQEEALLEVRLQGMEVLLTGRCESTRLCPEGG